MHKFYELYNSFEDFYNTILRGNEIEFVYNKKQFYIIPYYDINGKVIGACLGEASSDNDMLCLSSDELYKASVENSIFNLILEEIDIIWSNF